MDHVTVSCDHVTGPHSTMSGRRLRDAVKTALVNNGFTKEVVPVIAGLSNTYADYVATFEEYQVRQCREIRCSMFGPTTVCTFVSMRLVV